MSNYLATEQKKVASGDRALTKASVKRFPLLRTIAFLGVVLALSLSYPAFVRAHDLWINISSHFVKPGQAVKAYLGWGHHYPFSDFLSPTRVQSISVLMPDGTMVPLTPRDEGPGIPIEVKEDGVYMVGVAMKPGYYTKTKKGHTFKSKKESQDVISSIWYEKSAKAVFCAGRATNGAYEKSFGHSVEIIPLDNPCGVRAGNSLRVKVLLNGKPLGDAFLYKSRLGDSGNDALPCPAKTDSKGIAKILLDKAGIWRLMVKEKRPPADPSLCDYRTYTAFFTIAVR